MRRNNRFLCVCLQISTFKNNINIIYKVRSTTQNISNIWIQKCVMLVALSFYHINKTKTLIIKFSLNSIILYCTREVTTSLIILTTKCVRTCECTYTYVQVSLGIA